MPLSVNTAADEKAVLIVEHVADTIDTSVLDLPPLYEVLNPEALDALLAADDVTVSFTYCGHRVTVSSDDSISVTDSHASDPER